MEFLADLDDILNHRTVSFDDCHSLGAVNLRGTGFAARHREMRSITAPIDGVAQTVTPPRCHAPGLPAREDARRTRSRAAERLV